MLLRRWVVSSGRGFILFGILFFSALLLLCVSYASRADTANLNLSLTITMPPQCNFNNGSGTRTVSFGEVQQGLIDGVSYKRSPIDMGLTCMALEKNALRMTLTWGGVTLNGVSAVSTNRSNLGIAIYRDTTRLSNGASISFNYGTPPNLYAVPVKPNGMMLTDAGTFNGTMTVTLNYQ